ncbi:MAG TPA: type I polyketide synthase [Pyrinomonadaceae bacterium]|nr:type I polyketide synthase [Pyrinomonadaceae bacterium]
MQIAVIAFDGRFPGGADNPDAFWEALAAGRDLIEAVPATRWSTERFCQPESTGGLTHVSRRGGFLRDVDQFDPEAFGIAPREAETMDPAQRLLLESTWRCWESAGLRPSDWTERPVGVFVGAFTPDYLLLQLGNRDTTVSTLHSATGTAQTLLSNRISYCYGLTGPSLTVDTACSSSLVALHLAVSSLEKGESDIAFAAGVQLQLTPYHTGMESRGGFLSPDGVCRAFDHRANGYVRGEAAAAVLLAPLDLAMAENWPIHAVIYATGVNQNGKSAGISHPNAGAQERLLRATLRRSGIRADDLGYVEAHGTGTRAGDLAELHALGAALGGARESGPLLIGSVKTNAGHTEAASGLVGLIKVILSLRHRQVPPHLHWEQSPAGIDLQKLGLRLPLRCESWPEHADHAAVNSFGFGGTNASVVLGPPPERAAPTVPAENVLPKLFLLSAPTPEHLALQSKELSAFVASLPVGTSLDQLSGGLCYQREPFAHRVVLVDATAASLSKRLADFSRRPSSSEWTQGVCQDGGRRQVTWVFSGMGPQWHSIGRELANSFPVFTRAFFECDRLFGQIAGYSVLEKLSEAENDHYAVPTEWAQPLNFFFQIALARLLQSFGVQPSAIVGHSVGEIAAFHISGALDLVTALTLVYHRSRLQARVTGQGSMVAVGASASTVRSLAERHRVCIAATNSPSAVTVAGSNSAVDSFLASALEAGWFTRRLNVEVPYHSSLMAPLADEFRSSIAHLHFQEPKVPLYSTVTGLRWQGDQSFSEYWWKNLREPVAFAPAIDAMQLDHEQVVQELSAHPVLGVYLREILADANLPVLPTLKRTLDERTAFLECLGGLHVHGIALKWSELIPPPQHAVPLPPFVWRKQRFWSESIDKRAVRLAEPSHPLLGCLRTGDAATWDATIGGSVTPEFADHVVMGQPRLPAAAMIEMLHAAAQIVAEGRAVMLNGMRILRGVPLVDGSLSTLTTRVNKEDGRAQIVNAEGALIAESHLVTSLRGQESRVPSWTEIETPNHMNREEFYDSVRAMGFGYGPSFQRIESLEFNREHCRAIITGTTVKGYFMPPAVLDAALQTLLAFEMLSRKEQPESWPLKLPVGVSTVRLTRELRNEDFPLIASSTLLRNGEEETLGDVLLQGAKGELLAELSGVTFRAIPVPSALSVGTRLADTLFKLTWKAQALRPTVAHRGDRQWLVCSREFGAGRAFAEVLRSTGAQVDVLDGTKPEDPAWRLLLTANRTLPITVVDLQALDWRHGNAEEDIGSLQAVCSFSARLTELAEGEVEIWTATRGAHDEPSPLPGQAAIWGLDRGLIRAEHSANWRGIVDLPVDLPEGWASALRELIESNPQANEFKWTSGSWAHSCLERCPASPSEQPLWLRPDASYAVTGAFGALGRATANYLVARRARHLVLFGRAQLPERRYWDHQLGDHLRDRVEWVRSLERRGTQVLSFDDSDNWIQRMEEREFPALRGIVHAAGVCHDQPLLTSEREKREEILNAKILGISHLLTKVPRNQLDFLVFYSSIAGLLPGYGQSVYAAANTYLDALARKLRADGMPAISIAWGPWTIGMGGDEQLQQAFRKQGLQPITSAEGMRMLSTCLAQRESVVYCVSLRSEAFIAANRRHLWQIQQLRDVSLADLADAPSERQKHMAHMTSAERREVALKDLRQASAQILRLPLETLSAETNLSRVGLDSLMAVELQLMLAEKWHKPLDISAILGRESLGSLANLLAQEFGATPSTINTEKQPDADLVMIHVSADTTKTPDAECSTLRPGPTERHIHVV